MQDVLLARQGNISVYLSVHSSGEKLIIPWGHTDQPYHDKENILQLLQIGRSLNISSTQSDVQQFRAAMGPEGANYTIGNVKAAFGSVSRSLAPLFVSLLKYFHYSSPTVGLSTGPPVSE